MNILDKRFKYVPASRTNLKLTFAKARKELEKDKLKRLEKIFHLPVSKKA